MPTAANGLAGGWGASGECTQIRWKNFCGPARLRPRKNTTTTDATGTSPPFGLGVPPRWGRPSPGLRTIRETISPGVRCKARRKLMSFQRTCTAGILNESQRAMIAAKMANLKNGQRADYAQTAGVEISTPAVCALEASQMLNVDRQTVFSAKRVLSDGTIRLRS